MAMLYTHSIGNQPQNTMVVFKMSDSVPSARYPPICNVLRQWKTSLIPIYSLDSIVEKKIHQIIGSFKQSYSIIFTTILVYIVQ